MVFVTESENQSNYHKVSMISILLFAFVILFSANSVFAQSTEIYISVDSIDTEPLKADFTLGEIPTIDITGNISVSTDSAAVTVYFGIYAPDGWTTSITPEEVTVTFPDDEFTFEGTITPSSQSSQEDYTVYVWASVEEKNPSDHDIISSTANVFSERTIIEVIQNRVSMLSEIISDPILPSSTVVNTFTVTNLCTVSDVFYIDLVDDEKWKNLGWIITQSENDLLLEPGESREFTVTKEVPEDADVGDYEFEVVVSSEGHAMSKQTQTLTTKVRVPNVAEPFNIMPFMFIAFVGIGISLGAFFAATEVGYLALLSIFLPLYVRLKKKDVLSHFTRGQIFGYIQANPGAHYNAIIQYLDLHNGVGAYHLNVLEREGYIKSVRDGIYKRFYPRNMRIPEKRLHLSRIQRDVLGEVQKHPGISQKQIAKLLDESKQVINYNVKILENATLIRVERYGRETACYAGNVRYVAEEDVYEIVEDKSSSPVMNM
jgi:DNA-binding MarR family transcriptional regulator